MLKRHIETKLTSHLEIMPVVMIRGARQSGKTTLTHMLGKENGYAFYTLDDNATLSNATKDPVGWINSIKKPAIIDEVQRAPEIFLSIKADVDRNRCVGRYILTGSANPLLLPRLGDSLAGRMGLIDLFPFSQGEIRQKKETFIEYIFAEDIIPKIFSPLKREEIHEVFIRGGFPSMQSISQEKIDIWMGSYLQTMMDRDVRDISHIEGLRDFPILFRLLASRSANLLNISDLSRTLSMTSPTLKRYIRLLETLYFVCLLPGWYSNLGKRLIKSPKIHICDTGILSYLLSIDAAKLISDPFLMGSMMETFVFTELQKLQSWSSIRFHLYHFRDSQYEVDFILERPDGSLIGIEVKSTHSIDQDDLKGLRHLKSLTKKKFRRGIVLYQGETMGCYDKNLWVIPIQALWE